MKKIGLKNYFVVSYNSIKTFFYILHGIYRISKLNQKIVTIFGGRLVQKDNAYFQQAYNFAQKLAQNNISVITGGGSGIMEAGICGAESTNKKNIALGININGVNEPPQGSCNANIVNTNYFFIRQFLLITYADAFVFFPGGIGTMDELFEVLNLIATKKLERLPVILIGKNYWLNIINWMKLATEEKLILHEHTDIITITDSIDEALQIILKNHPN